MYHTENALMVGSDKYNKTINVLCPVYLAFRLINIILHQSFNMTL